jgi:N-acetylglucosaminyldiphosphoundecaprenol N-acetyl-beta-D-mannosaminyltransferase
MVNDWGEASDDVAPYVSVGPFGVLDARRVDFVDHVVRLTSASAGEPVLVYALHVGGLNCRRDPVFVDAMNKAHAVYADGGSVVVLAKIAGARVIERAPTTDVGWDVLRALSASLNRPLRIALLGGPVGLAERAGRVFEEDAPVRVVFTDHGYHRDWSATLRSLRAAAPDVVLVGMGAPGEMVWCEQHRSQLPPSLVLTCGGWFGHVTGDEHRAPRLVRRSGIEWVARVAQSPRRLGPRYARGIGSSLAMSLPALRQRSKARLH